MTMKELMKESAESLAQMRHYMVMRGNHGASYTIYLVQEFAHKRVRVVKGRKVPIGTEGEVFWMGSYNHAKYADPWGIYTTYRVGIKDDDGNIYWTSVDNIKVVEVEE